MVSNKKPPRWLPQCSYVVIESSFDPGERLQAPGSLWFIDGFFYLGVHIKHRSAVGAILVEGPNRLTYFWKRTIQ
jgi:hypothetical protein